LLGILISDSDDIAYDDIIIEGAGKVKNEIEAPPQRHFGESPLRGILGIDFNVLIGDISCQKGAAPCSHADVDNDLESALPHNIP